MVGKDNTSILSSSLNAAYTGLEKSWAIDAWIVALEELSWAIDAWTEALVELSWAIDAWMQSLVSIKIGVH